MALIDKDNIDHLAGLSRIRLTEAEKEKLLRDLQEILDYFEELKKLDTEKVEPMTGGTLLRDTARDDIVDIERLGKGRDVFPETKDGYLKVPPVFDLSSQE